MAEEKKAKRKHLHKVELEDTESGHILEHHTYKKDRHSTETEPQRKNVAVHATPEEAGQSATEALGQNAPPDPNADPGAQPAEPAADGMPDAGAMAQ